MQNQMIEQILADPELLATYLALSLGFLGLIVLGAWLWRRWLLVGALVAVVATLCFLAPTREAEPIPAWFPWALLGAVGMALCLAIAYSIWQGSEAQRYRKFRYGVIIHLRQLGLPVERADGDGDILASLQHLSLKPPTD